MKAGIGIFPTPWCRKRKAGTYTHLALSAIKYLKGISDTNGDLEQLNITPTATNGTVVQLQLQNNGDVQCLPALAGQPGTVPGVTTRYFTTNGAELTATVLTAEGVVLHQHAPTRRADQFVRRHARQRHQRRRPMTTPCWRRFGIRRTRWASCATVNCFTAAQPAGIVAGRRHWQRRRDRRFGFERHKFHPARFRRGHLGHGDAFHFVWQTNNGDGTITARVTSQIGGRSVVQGRRDDPRKHGRQRAQRLRVRHSRQRRQFSKSRQPPAASSYSTAVAGLAAPYWVRLTRSGTTFTALCSSNGVNWVAVGQFEPDGLCDFGALGFGGDGAQQRAGQRGDL